MWRSYWSNTLPFPCRRSFPISAVLFVFCDVLHKRLLGAEMVVWRETCENSVRNEVQNDVTGEERRVTSVTVDRIRGERLMFGWGGGSCSIVSLVIGMGLVRECGLSGGNA